MKQWFFFLALSLGTAGRCCADEVTVSRNVIMRSDHGLASLKAGTVVDLVSRDDKAITIRYNGQIGTIPPNSVVEPEPTRTEADAPASTAPGPSPVTPCVILGSLTLFLANSPADSPNELREYIPDDETLEHWLHMASTWVLKDSIDPQAYLKEVEADAAKANSKAHSRFWPNNGPALEFMTYAPMSYSLKFAQWNLMRASHVDGRGLVVYQYAVRYFNYGDATAAKVTAERDSMLGPFGASSFEELTDVLKPHNIRLCLVTDMKVGTFFPEGTFRYCPRISLDFTGYMPGGIAIPAVVTTGGKVWLSSAWNAVLLDSKGTAMLSADPGDGPGSIASSVTLKGKDGFKIHTDRAFCRGFELHAGGTYTLVFDCYLTDQDGKKFNVSASRNVTIVDNRASDRSMDPAYQP